MESILEINIGICAVVLDAIKLTADERNRVMTFSYGLVDFDIISADAKMLLHTGLSEGNSRYPLKRFNSFSATLSRCFS